MKKYLYLTGLMMSALLCLFTACVTDDDDDFGGSSQTDIANAEVKLIMSDETLKWAEGSFVITYSPSGKTEEVAINDLTFAFSPNPVTDADLQKYLQSPNLKKTSKTTLCTERVDKITVTPKIRIKSGIDTSADATYQFEMAASIHYGKTIEKGQSTSGKVSLTNVKGSELESTVKRNGISLAVLEIRR